MTHFESLGTVSHSTSTVTMALSCIISKIKRDIGLKWRFFSYPLAFDTYVKGSPSEYCNTLWCRNGVASGYPTPTVKKV